MTDTDDKKADEGQTEPVYGGCEGPSAMYVKLISSDDHEFIINRDYALTSGTIKAMLSGPGQFSENETNEVYFREIPSHVLAKVCTYFMYKVRYTNSSTEIPEFPIAPEIALELLMAANFLDCWRFKLYLHIKEEVETISFDIFPLPVAICKYSIKFCMAECWYHA